MKILVTGSSGFLGSALCKRLLGQSHSVVKVPRQILYQKELLADLFKKEKPDLCYHLAAYGNHYNQKDSTKTLFANVVGTFNVFEAAKLTGTKVFNFSTSSVTLPTQTIYSVTKLMSEELSLIYPDVVNVRPYSIFGEGEADFRFIPTVCRSLILNEELQLDPEPIHDWVYVENFIDVLLSNTKTKETVLEIGTGIGHTNENIVEKLATISGKSCRIRKVASLRDYDSSKWIALTGEKMKVSLDVGLLKTYQYYERQFKN